MRANPSLGDLAINLIHGGKTARLIIGSDFGSPDFADTYCFSDAGTASLDFGAEIRSIPSTYVIPGLSQNVTYRPKDAFSVFNGLATGGEWTVFVSDTGPVNTGTIDSATLTASKCPEGKLLALRRYMGVFFIAELMWSCTMHSTSQATNADEPDGGCVHSVTLPAPIFLLSPPPPQVALLAPT